MAAPLRVLVLSPYHGGSHAAFVDGWRARSRLAWTVLSLPAHHWKWRMRHAAWALAEQATARWRAGERWDLIFATDMLDLAAFGGLVPPAIAALPRVLYGHENQAVYPDPRVDHRDIHFALTNAWSALAADAVWWNSAWHRDAFLGALDDLWPAMPDHRPTDVSKRIAVRSLVMPPGIDVNAKPSQALGPLHIGWVARWEHDKDPDTFFAAIDRLADREIPFSLSVLGQSFQRVPPIFASARDRLDARIRHWGFQPTRAAYEAALAELDVVVSTARHEFFGIAMVEATAVGAWPLLPRRLAYPEVFAAIADDPDRFHDDTPDDIADRLTRLADRKAQAGRVWSNDHRGGATAMAAYHWARLAPRYDDAFSALTATAGQRKRN